MHYIRLLRPARFDATSHDISLLITITTDLGDSFLHPDAPVDLVVAADSPTGESLLPLVARGHPPPPRRRWRWRWAAGMRVLDIKVPLLAHLRKEHVTCTVTIRPAPPLGFIGSADVLPTQRGSAGGRPPAASRGLIMPAAVEMVGGVCSPVSLRTLQFRGGSQPRDLCFEEDIGESIARHIWDAGVVTACFLADACLAKEDISDVLPIRKDHFSVLELGSGVGILGITVARILEQAAAAQGTSLREATVLLTDLPEAGERARSNISRAAAALRSDQDSAPAVVLRYENLDWDDGRRGQLGPLAAARAWDLVVLSDCTYNVDSLPALVGTLSALHSAGLEHASERDADSAKSSVLLATKPRHSSERALFGLLEADGWRYRVLKSIPLPKLGEEDEVVEIYMLEKGMGRS
ncbi:hypothetical protein Hte_008107 [Hypoxylon texense]